MAIMSEIDLTQQEIVEAWNRFGEGLITLDELAQAHMTAAHALYVLSVPPPEKVALLEWTEPRPDYSGRLRHDKSKGGA